MYAPLQSPGGGGGRGDSALQALGRREGNKLRQYGPPPPKFQSLLYTGKAIYWEASDAIDHLIIWLYLVF